MVLRGSRSTRQMPIGLDIGLGGVRAVQLRHVGHAWITAHAARCERTDADGGDAQSVDDLERRIRTCLRQAEFRGRKVVTALSSPEVEFHALDLPQAVFSKPDAHVAQVVRSELLRLANEPGEHVETRHWALPPTKVPGPLAIGVAARRAVIDHTLAACDHARTECSCIDTVATGLCRFGGLLDDWGDGRLWGILDAGCRETRLVLCVDEVPVLVRTAGTGGREWTRRIAESLEISVKSAEIQKREHGFTLQSGQPGRRANDPPTAELGSVLRGILRSDLNELAAEVKRSYEYVLSCYPSYRAADLVLVGGGAALGNLPEFLTEALGIPVRRASSYLDGDSCRLRYASGKQNPLEVFALAVGLAVGG